MKNKLSKIMFMAGFLVCISPMAFNLFMARGQKQIISTYEKSAEQHAEEYISEKEAAMKYNDLLFQTGGNIVDNVDQTVLSENNYEELLNLTNTGVMGSLEIPKIDVRLPIYHGTSDDVLASGLGHLQGTSLPVGGKNTHAVITGHRGLPSSKLLVRLDEMKKDDLFYVKTGNETLAYKVSNIATVDPSKITAIDIKPDKDLVSIVTCTPYGINTKRLIVTGERVPFKEAEYKSIPASIPSIREIVFTVLPFVFFLVVVIGQIIKRRMVKHENIKK